jgi:hypothetical protein
MNRGRFCSCSFSMLWMIVLMKICLAGGGRGLAPPPGRAGSGARGDRRSGLAGRE